jgi:MFS family permease
VKRSGVAAIGVGQLVNWGVLYYAFGVLLVPLERDLGLDRWIVAGAFSVALLMSAAAAPAIGRWVDGGHGRLVMRAGGFGAAAILVAWAALPGVCTLYLAWAGLGLCMAASLYEPAFAIIGRVLDSPRDRLAALAGVTVLGGLASTLFLPLTSVLVQHLGWRGAVLCLATIVAASTAAVTYAAFRAAPTSNRLRRAEAIPGDERSVAADTPRDPGLTRLLVVFSCSNLASAALTTNLVPALIERQFLPTSAATLAGLLGVMQLPGRLLMMRRARAPDPGRLLTGSLLCQAVGFAILATARPAALVAVGVGAFAFGAGLGTLVRPYLVQVRYGIDRAGYLNGVIARSQQLARAGGPVLAAALYALGGYGIVFGLFGALLVALAFVSRERAEMQAAVRQG